jgi:hypothetical protein
MQPAKIVVMLIVHSLSMLVPYNCNIKMWQNDENGAAS